MVRCACSSAQLVPPPHRSFSSSVPPESAARPVSQPTRAGFTDADDDLVDSSGSVTAPRQGVRRSIVGPLGGRGLASLRSVRVATYAAILEVIECFFFFLS